MEATWYERAGDALLTPFMWLINGFRTPVQETHGWHTVDVPGKFFPAAKGVKIVGNDTARFGHGSPMGLFHMPIFGGLTKYAVVKAQGVSGHWHLCFKGPVNAQIHRLQIVDPMVKVLVGKHNWYVYGVDDSGKLLRLKVVGHGKIGDGQFPRVRLF